ncbi:MAG: hypothetical protein JSS81_11690 [Acidobacteria bacterium]|nr:hypothetical protein [Acidobacteriota bacterium]
MKKIIVTILFAAAVFSANRAFGQIPVETRGEAVYFGMQTIPAGQSLRLTVVNPKPLVVREIEPCIRVRIVIDAYAVNQTDATRFRFSRRIERSLTLDAGEATALDLTAARTGGDRLSVSVFIVPVEGTLPAGEPVVAHTTLEMRLLDRTIFTFPGVIKGFNPQRSPNRRPDDRCGKKKDNPNKLNADIKGE